MNESDDEDIWKYVEQVIRYLDGETGQTLVEHGAHTSAEPEPEPEVDIQRRGASRGFEEDGHGYRDGAVTLYHKERFTGVWNNGCGI
jgi:hypothetical protein